jgi:ABC-2 type transport system permease protein
VISRLTARRAVRSGVIFGYIFGAATASSAISYTRFYRTAAQRDALAAAYGSNRATSALFGPAPELQTVAGFTVFKISMTLILLGAVWGLLTSTRLLRGEEESGRWELLLAGPVTRRGAVVQALRGLGAGVVALWALTGLITAVSGLDPSVRIAVGPALYFALAMAASAVMFLAVGALTSQLAGTRRQAAAYAAWILGVSYAVRLVADAGLGLHGLIWASPLGWVEELRPLTAPAPLALVPIAALTAVLLTATVYLAGVRDVGAGIVPDRASRRPHLRLLGGPTGPADGHQLVGGDRRLGAAVRAHRPVGRRHDFRIIGAGPGQARFAGERHGRGARRLLPHPGGPGRLRRRPTGR